MNRPKTTEELNLIQLIKESKRLLQKASRKAKIKFYRDALMNMGYDVYFWDTVKKRQEEGRRGYRVCFAYKAENNTLFFETSFCHAKDNFDRLHAWEDLYNKVDKYPNGLYVIPVKSHKKTDICDALRKETVHGKVTRPSLFSKHCKTWLKDV